MDVMIAVVDRGFGGCTEKGKGGPNDSGATGEALRDLHRRLWVAVDVFGIGVKSCVQVGPVGIPDRRSDNRVLTDQTIATTLDQASHRFRAFGEHFLGGVGFGLTGQNGEGGEH